MRPYAGSQGRLSVICRSPVSLASRAGTAIRSGRILSDRVSSVEVLHVELAAAQAARLHPLLSPEEHERAARLSRPEPWIVARAALRIALGARLGTAPEAVRFGAGPHGKPEVPGVRFNLSHSGARALIALADVEVGVDVERTARSSRAVERTLTVGERAALGAGDRHVELLRVWCRKEALAKAIGGGLGWAPERFDTSRPDGFALIDLELGAGYVGALAVAGERPEIALRRLTLGAEP
jgi:4'-phosphopantetheinyl transferase